MLGICNIHIFIYTLADHPSDSLDFTLIITRTPASQDTVPSSSARCPFTGVPWRLVPALPDVRRYPPLRATHISSSHHNSAKTSETSRYPNKSPLTILLAFQNCTTLITCLPAQIGNVTPATSWGHDTRPSTAATPAGKPRSRHMTSKKGRDCAIECVQNLLR